MPAPQRQAVARVNQAGLAALREHLASGDMVALLGAAGSAPLYPTGADLIGELVGAAADRLTDSQATTCRALAVSAPEEVAEIVRRSVGTAAYREILREVLRPRTDPGSGRSWTPVQELVCRGTFSGGGTTNYDLGILAARTRGRPTATAAGFTSWDDHLCLDRWRAGDFWDTELPVLFAQGQRDRLGSRL